MAKIAGKKIIFGAEDWAQGLLPNYSASNLLNQKGTGLASARTMNPFLAYGYALPGLNPTDVTNVAQVTTLIRNGVVNGTSAYLVSNGALIHQLTSLDITPAITNAGAFPHTITPTGGTSPVGDDIVIYSAKTSGTTAIGSRIFYTYSSSTIWEVGMYDFTNFSDSFMSSVAVTTPLASPYTTGGVGKPHPMIVGDDDILYIADRNFVHAYDGVVSAVATLGKFSPAVLTLPNGYIITSFARAESGLMVFAYLENSSASGSFYLGKSFAFLWNYNDLDITRSYDLTDNYVSEAFNYKGTIGCFTQGRPNDPSQTRLTCLRLFNGSIFETVASIIHNAPIRGGVNIVGDSIQWNSDGVIYSYGSPLAGTKAGLHRLSEGLGSNSGFFRTLASTLQIISSGATTSGGLQYLTGYYFQSSFSTGVAEPTFSSGTKGKVTNVKVRFGGTVTGGRSITIQLSDRGVTTSTVINAQETVTGQAGMVTKKVSDSSGAPFLVFDGLKLVVSWATGSGATVAPALESVEVDFDEITVD